MADFSGIVNSVPPVTRFTVIATSLVTFSCLLGLIDPTSVYLNYHLALHRYQIYRPITSFLFAGSGFPLIYDLFLLYRNGASLENETYGGRTGEYAWMNLMLMVELLLLNLLPPLSLPFLFRPFLHAQNYLWCRSNPTMKMSLFGLISVPVPYYPAALIVLDLVTGGTSKALGGIIGMCAGHLWWFLSTYLPSHPSTSLRLPNPLSPPRWFLKLFPVSARETAGYRGTGFSAMPGGSFASRTGAGAGAGAGGTTSARSSATSGGGGGGSHRWGGGGNRLGGEPL